jgi:plastocyanin
MEGPVLRHPGHRQCDRWLLLLVTTLIVASCAGAPTPPASPTAPAAASPAAATAAVRPSPTDPTNPTPAQAAAATRPATPVTAASPAAGQAGAAEPCAAASFLSQLQTPVPASPSPAAATKPAASPPAGPTATPRPAPQEDRVGFPDGYQNTFKLLLVLDRPDNKQVRIICGNDMAAGVAPGQPYPHGSVLVMETYRARQDASGAVVKDANGRFIREALVGIFVMRKEQGFGAAYEQDRSGEWEYVGYRPDKSYQTPPRNSNACAACHLNQAGADQDYVFRTSLFRTQSATPPAVGQNEVVIDIYAFHPATLTIKAGTTVRWVNGDEAEHTIVARNNAFKSEVLKSKPVKPGESFSHTFVQPGTYEYICSIHPTMTAKIEVTS